ncbi:MAG TPA: ribonuclease HII [Brumimicrobium sp.]|nr:ribonuclease HII [Brumimicrobium sp.]
MILFFSPDKIEAGCDEAGRGCLAGPVVASAVILDKNNPIPGLNDSKQLSAKKRKELVPIIKRKALAYSVAFIDQNRIDEINILNASFEAMHKAIEGLNKKPNLLLIDGNRFKEYPEIEHKCIVKGDAKFQSIAAASILAKEARDDFMKEIDEEFPQYEWKKNMGYPTKKHKLALHKYGDTKYHRKTFKY